MLNECDCEKKNSPEFYCAIHPKRKEWNEGNVTERNNEREREKKKKTTIF